MNTSNLKDTVTTICGIVFVIASTLLGLNLQGIALPHVIIVIAGTLVAVTTAVTMYLTGKAPNGTNKTDNQIGDQNKKNP
jgi:flagellar motor component MotA